MTAACCGRVGLDLAGCQADDKNRKQKSFSVHGPSDMDFRLPISDCRLTQGVEVKSKIGNWRSSLYFGSLNSVQRNPAEMVRL